MTSLTLCPPFHALSTSPHCDITMGSELDFQVHVYIKYSYSGFEGRIITCFAPSGAVTPFPGAVGPGESNYNRPAGRPKIMWVCLRMRKFAQSSLTENH